MCCSGLLRRGGEGLVEVPQDVVRVLEPDRDADEVRADAAGDERLVAELLVRRGRRVDDERADVADVGEVAAQLDRLDEPPAGVAPAATPNETPRPGPRR